MDEQSENVLAFTEANAKVTDEEPEPVVYRTGGGLLGPLVRAFLGNWLAQQDVWVVEYQEWWGSNVYALPYYADDEYDALDQWEAEKGSQTYRVVDTYKK